MLIHHNVARSLTVNSRKIVKNSLLQFMLVIKVEKYDHQIFPCSAVRVEGYIKLNSLKNHDAIDHNFEDNRLLLLNVVTNACIIH